MQWCASTLKKITYLMFLLMFTDGIALDKNSNIADDMLGTWEANIRFEGLDLELLMHINKNDSGKLVGSIDSPTQNAFNITLSDVARNDLSLSYQSNLIGASFRGTLNTNTSTIEGVWKQNGIEVAVMWVRQSDINNDSKISLPLRPQTPVAPFTYDSLEYSFQSNASNIILSGTLTLPENTPRSPGIVLISGSGPQDRDSRIYNHPVFSVISDMLTRHGFAVLRYDDRGIGESQGKYNEATTYDFADDAIGAAMAISNHPRVNKQRITYIGLSEGAVIAAIAQNRSPLVSEIAMLSPPILPYSDISIQQAHDITLSAGADKSAAERAAEDQRAINDVALAAIKQNSSMRNAVEKKLLEMGLSSDFAIRRAQPFGSVWLNTYIQLDPYDEIKNIDVPILAIWGEKDVQVNAEQNLQKMSTLSAEKDIETKVFPDLNHLLQPATTGAVTEYASIDLTISDEVITEIVEWISLRHDKADHPL